MVSKIAMTCRALAVRTWERWRDNGVEAVA
jgi:hypothetical protein